MTTPTPAELDYSTTCQGHAGTDPVDFHGRAEKCIYAIHGSLMLGREGVPEAIRYLKAWTDAARRAPTPDRVEKLVNAYGDARSAFACRAPATTEADLDEGMRLGAAEHAALTALLAAWDDLERERDEARDLYRETEIRRSEALTALSRVEGERDAARRLVADFQAKVAAAEHDGGTECSYCHGIGACPRCWGRAGIERAESRALAAERQLSDARIREADQVERRKLADLRSEHAEAGWKLAAADLARETERANRAEERSELVAGAAASESLRADAATERAERAAALRSALASTPEAPAAPSAEEATAPQFIPGGAFCGCGRVEFVCPGVPVARTHGPDGVTLHRPGGCRLATDAELSNLPAPAATPDPTTTTKEE